MVRFLLSRLTSTVLIVLTVSVLSFSLIHLLSGDVELAYLGPNPPRDQIAIQRHKIGLDKPLADQYWRYFSHVLQGDLGNSPVNGSSVAGLLRTRFPITLEVLLVALFLGSIIGIASGVLAAVMRNSIFDVMISTISMLGVAMPSFYRWAGTAARPRADCEPELRTA